MAISRWRRPLQHRVVLAISVDYTSEQRQRGRSLAHDMIGDYPVSALEEDLRDIVERDLPRELSSIFDLRVETEVLGTKRGSLTMFFGALIAAYPLIASYHDFAESVELIRKHCATLVKTLDATKYNDMLSSSVSVYYPTIPSSGDYPYRWFRHILGHPEGEMFAAASFTRPATGVQRRDAFFWYLVVMNLALVALVAILVYRSVAFTYFDEHPAKSKREVITTPSTPVPARTTTRQ